LKGAITTENIRTPEGQIHLEPQTWMPLKISGCFNWMKWLVQEPFPSIEKTGWKSGTFGADKMYVLFDSKSSMMELDGPFSTTSLVCFSNVQQIYGQQCTKMYVAW